MPEKAKRPNKDIPMSWPSQIFIDLRDVGEDHAKRIDRLEEQFNHNADILGTCAVTLNLICKKLGVKNEEIIAALADVIKESAERKSVQPSGAQPPVSDSGNGEPAVSDGPISGTDSRSRESTGDQTGISDQSEQT